MYSKVDYMYGDRDVLPASFPPATPFSPATTHSSFTTIGGSYGFETPERIYAYRPAMPPTAEENSEQLLDKLEQAGRVPSKEKFRRMACNTFIFTGACPYNDRCVFLHDYRIKAEGMKVRTTRQNKANATNKDTFYWPDMTRKDVMRNVDGQGLPTANQIYMIPEAFKVNPANFHNRGLYSLWAHFVEFCIHNNIYYSGKQRDLSSEAFFQISGYKENPHISGAKRLDVLIHLSLGKSIQSERRTVGILEEGPFFQSDFAPLQKASMRKTWSGPQLESSITNILDDWKYNGRNLDLQASENHGLLQHSTMLKPNARRRASVPNNFLPLSVLDENIPSIEKDDDYSVSHFHAYSNLQALTEDMYEASSSLPMNNIHKFNNYDAGDLNMRERSLSDIISSGDFDEDQSIGKDFELKQINNELELPETLWQSLGTSTSTMQTAPWFECEDYTSEKDEITFGSWSPPTRPTPMQSKSDKVNNVNNYAYNWSENQQLGEMNGFADFSNHTESAQWSGPSANVMFATWE